jgi:hypothetical protein
MYDDYAISETLFHWQSTMLMGLRLKVCPILNHIDIKKKFTFV